MDTLLFHLMFWLKTTASITAFELPPFPEKGRFQADRNLLLWLLEVSNIMSVNFAKPFVYFQETTTASEVSKASSSSRNGRIDGRSRF